jgi:ABC-type sugar transport system ATPase subunit
MEYPGVRALRGVDFDLQAGEIHALCGENGAGKSTLIKILSGIIPHGRYGGDVEMTGKACRFDGPAAALKAGIRVIHQELALAEDLSVAENVCLGEEPTRHGLLDKLRMESETREQLGRLGLEELDPWTLAGSLPVGIKQMVEIARALRCRGKVLILDEPTSALSAREAMNLEKAFTFPTASMKCFGLRIASQCFATGKAGEPYPAPNSMPRAWYP